MDITGKLIIDGVLTAGFGVQHSILATLRVKALANKATRIDALAWRSVESIVNVLYVLVAAVLWLPVTDIVWRVTGWPATAMTIVLAASWVWYWQIHLFEYDCGLAFGSSSLVTALASKGPLKNPPWKVGSRRWIRFPVHTAFFPMFFCFPVMRADVLVLAIVLNIYNILGSVLYDRRILRLVGEPYQKYIDVTGLILPNFKHPRGAADIKMLNPVQWKIPSAHFPAFIIGVGLGIFYWYTIGSPTRSLESLSWLACMAILGSIIVGFCIGLLPIPGIYKDWGGMQTNISTSVSLSAAVGVITWGGIVWLRTGYLPLLAAPLPMWFIVQYLGHVVAYFVGGRKWLGETQPQEEAFPAIAD